MTVELKLWIAPQREVLQQAQSEESWEAKDAKGRIKRHQN